MVRQAGTFRQSKLTFIDGVELHVVAAAFDAVGTIMNEPPDASMYPRLASILPTQWDADESDAPWSPMRHLNSHGPSKASNFFDKLFVNKRRYHGTNINEVNSDRSPNLALRPTRAQVYQNDLSRLKPSANPNRSLESFELVEESNPETRVGFTTTQGQRGWGLGPVQVGDEIIVPLGAHTPFLVRFISTGSENGEAIYELVGDCYVESIMLGELEELVDTGRVETKTYRLR